MTDNTKISVHDLAHSKGMPAAATEAMLIMQDRIEALTAEKERLKTALRFYAAWGVFAPFHDDAIHIDSGGVARAALGETE